MMSYKIRLFMEFNQMKKLIDKKCERCSAIMYQVAKNRRFCNHCSNVMNAERQEVRNSKHTTWEKKKSRQKFKCPKCGEMKSTKKYRFCYDCVSDMRRNNIVDTMIEEHHVIA